MKYYVGIDGGGTKTEFVLSDEYGNIVGSLLKTGSNPNDIGIESCVEILREGLAELCGDLDKNELYIFAGVSGAGVADNAQRIAEQLSWEHQNITVASDLMNALEVCLGDADGIAMICGTGISCTIRTSGKLRMVGGYGYLFEDGGSGYGYGRDAVKAVLRLEDGVGKETILSTYFKEIFPKSIRFSLREILQSGKSGVAAFCPLVFKGYKNNDPVCKKIIESNLDATVALLKEALSVCGMKTPKIAFIGGVSKTKEFRERIEKEFPLYETIFCEEKPVLGALRLARKEKRK